MELTEVLDKEMAALFGKRSYKESKRILQNAIKTMSQITFVFDGMLHFENEMLNADRLLDIINKNLKKRKQELADKIQMSRRNTKEYQLIDYIVKNDFLVGEIKNFIACFNRLEVEARRVIYYSLFQNESNAKLEGKLFLSMRQVRTIKHKATEHLTDGILLNQLLNRERPELKSLGLFSCMDIGGVTS